MSAHDDPHAPTGPSKRPRTVRRIAIVLGAVLLALAGLFALTRYGVLLPQARLLIEAQTDGLKIGRFGRLRIEGLSGDVWDDLRIRKLTLRDEKGVWLEARDIRLDWDYLALFRRTFYADALTIEQLRLLRRPTLEAGGQDRGLPVSFVIDEGHAQVLMTEAFSYRRGLYDVDFTLDVRRGGGGNTALVEARSLLNPGDRLDLRFASGEGRPLYFRLDAVEAQGGAVAGALGLPADKRFALHVAADGQMTEGGFEAVAVSGSTRPLVAQGAWNENGGQARGELSLTASELTEPLARRFGPEVRFIITGREAGPEYYALQARLAAENLMLTASGLGNLGERKLGPNGLSVVAATDNLSRVVGGSAFGAARLAGTVRSPGPAWRFEGRAVVSEVTLAGYSLDRVAGPVQASFRGGDLEVTTDLVGAGGQGSGFVAAALGRSPELSLEASRLQDGRLMVRNLQVEGAGLDLEATGGRGPLGGLNFKGQATLSNLTAARADARGALNVTWSASQPRSDRPLTVSVDAVGRNFASGFGQLDELLGDSPRLRARAAVEGRRIEVTNATVSGEDIRASTQGVLSPGGGLNFDIDWSATGPLQAGPAEISGRASGTGAITGRLTAPQLELQAKLESVDIPRLPLRDAQVALAFARRPDGSSGEIRVTADSPYGPARASSDFNFINGGVRLSDLSVQAGGLTAAGSFALRRGAPSAADLEVVLTEGAFLRSGRIAGDLRIVDAAGGAVADLELLVDNARIWGADVLVRSGVISAEGPLERLPYGLQAEGLSDRGRWRLEGRGRFSPTEPGYALTFAGAGSLGERALRTVEPAVFRFGGPVLSVETQLVAADGGQVMLNARQAENTAALDIKVAGLGLGVINEDLAGQITGQASLQGRGARLTGTFQARLTDAQGRGAPPTTAVDAAVTGRLANDTLFLEASATNDEGLRAEADLRLPTEASASPLRLAIARQRPMQGQFSAQGEVRPLWDLLAGGERSLSGQVSTQGALGGTLADPDIVGQFVMNNGRFVDGATGLALRDVSLSASFSDDAVNVAQVRAVDGDGGTVAGSGRISLLRQGVSTFRLDLNSFQLIDNEQATASATGKATIQRAADGKITLSGSLRIDEAEIAADLPTPAGVVDIQVTERNRPPGLDTSLEPPPRRGEGWALDVSLEAPGQVFLRGRGLDVELSLDAHVGGTTSRPRLSGTASVVRGDYDFAGKRFVFDPQSVVYLSTQPEDIRLNLTATRDDPTLTAVVRIRGTAADPDISLTSTPTLPSDEVLAHVLFGRSASQLSAFEAAQLASALSAMATGGGFDIIGNLREFAGLDRLTFGGGDESGLTVAGGKYLSDDVYLELIGGGREGPVVQVEWRVRRNIAVISRLLSQGDGRVSIRWRRSY